MFLSLNIECKTVVELGGSFPFFIYTKNGTLRFIYTSLLYSVMEVSRRRMIQIGGTALAVGVAGCSNTTTTDGPEELPRPELGNPENPTLQVFEDLGCGACATYSQNVFPQLFQEFVEGDLLHIEYYDFVLPADSFSGQAAHGGRAVQDLVGMTEFWEYTDRIFENQNVLDKKLILDTAEDLGADRATVEERVDSSYYQQVLDGDKNYGESVNVGGTPSFVMDGEIIELDFTNYTNFRRRLTQEL